jgi:hypothetical protein
MTVQDPTEIPTLAATMADAARRGVMSILYAIETCDGVRGTLADAHGVYADPLATAFMDDVALCRGGARGGWRSAA